VRPRVEPKIGVCDEKSNYIADFAAVFFSFSNRSDNQRLAT
jgi:hypothetical protein